MAPHDTTNSDNLRANPRALPRPFAWLATLVALCAFSACQSEEEATRIVCNPPPECAVAENDHAAYRRCMESRIHNAEVKEALDVLFEKSTPDGRYSLMLYMARLGHVDECPAADLLFDRMPHTEAVRVLCEQGMECVGDGIDFAACVDGKFPENARIRQELRGSLADRIDVIKRSRREHKLLGEPFPECPIYEHWQREAAPPAESQTPEPAILAESQRGVVIRHCATDDDCMLTRTKGEGRQMCCSGCRREAVNAAWLHKLRLTCEKIDHAPCKPRRCAAPEPEVAKCELNQCVARPAPPPSSIPD